MTRQASELIDSLVREIQTGRCPMPILLQGEEDFRVDEARRRVIAAFFPDESERRDAVETVSARDHDVGAIIARASEAPLFASRRALIVRDAELLARGPGGGTDAGDEGESRPATKGAKKSPAGTTTKRAGGTWAALPPDSIVILIARGSIDRRTRLYKEIETTGRALLFERLKTEPEVAAWVDARARHLKKTLEPGARALLVERTLSAGGVSLRLLALELEKLVLYSGDRPRITRADVEEVVGMSREETIFAVSNAIGEGNTARAVGLAAQILERPDESAIGLLALLAREFRLLLEARILLDRSPGARQATRMDYRDFAARVLPGLKASATPPGAEKPELALLSGHPYGAYSKLRYAGRFPVERLLHAVRELAAADRELKSSGRKDTLVIESLMVRLAQGTA